MAPITCSTRRRAVPPQGEAWSNLKLAQELAARMGLTDPVFRMSQPEILRELFRGATGAVAAFDPDTLRDAGPVSIAPKGGQEFRTPSGKLEFYSETLAKQGLAADAGLAARSGRGDARRAMAAASVDRRRDISRATLRFPASPSCASARARRICVLHPADADARAICATASVCGW